MKKILSLLFILITQTSIAQRITFSDMNFALKHSLEQTEDYMAKKGFTYGGIDTLQDSTQAYSYMFTKFSRGTINYMIISKKSYKNVFYGVSFYTAKPNDYLLLKGFIKSLGFKLKSTKTNSLGSLVIDYSKQDLVIEFMITRNNDSEITDYFISLTNKTISDIDYKINSN